jgi:hypothetical protein
MTIEPKSEEISRLRQHVDELLTLWDRVFSHPIRHDDTNLAFMALAFAARQGEHTRAVLRLQPSADAVLITRSMFEGLCQLLWAAQAPDDRPLRWRAFAYVQDWRTLQRKIKSGETVPPEERTRIENALQPYEHLFLTKDALMATSNGKALPANPYAHHWHGTSVKNIFTAVKGELVHAELYRQFSDWHHWDIAGFAPLLRLDEGGNVHQKSQNPDLTATALASAFQCLWQTLKALDEIVSLGIGAELQQCYDSYVTARP